MENKSLDRSTEYDKVSQKNKNTENKDNKLAQNSIKKSTIGLTIISTITTVSTGLLYLSKFSKNCSSISERYMHDGCILGHIFIILPFMLVIISIAVGMSVVSIVECYKRIKRKFENDFQPKILLAINIITLCIAVLTILLVVRAII